MSYHLIETSVLKVTKVKLSSLVWRKRHFKGQFLVLTSPIAKPSPQFTPFFIATGLPKQSKPTLLNKTKSNNHQLNCLLTWNIICRVGNCLHAARKQHKKLHNSAKTNQTLQQRQPPGISPGYPKCIPNNSPVSLQQHDSQLDT